MQAARRCDTGRTAADDRYLDITYCHARAL
jgi:hypothetical protein